jgi:hypothetical protein
MSDDDEFLAGVEADAGRSLVELRERRLARLAERVAGRLDRVVYWQADDDEVDDDEALAALEAFAPEEWDADPPPEEAL